MEESAEAKKDGNAHAQGVLEASDAAKEKISFVRNIREAFSMEPQAIQSYSPLTLAYIGDAIYDLVIRTMLVEQGNTQVNKLHKRASSYVKASAQKEYLLLIQELLTEQEMAVYKRGRNAKSITSAKNASIGEYRVATGFEALMGYLYLTEQYDRIIALITHAIKAKENGVKTDEI